MIFRRSVQEGTSSADEEATRAVGDPDEQPTTEHTTDDPEATTVREPDPDATTVREPDPEATTALDPDATTVREPDPEATTAPEPDPDATTAPEPDPDATTVREPDPDATAVRPLDDPDATAIRPPAEAVEFEPSEPGKPRKRRARRILLGVGIGVVVLAGAYVAAAYYLGDKVPQNTTVAGVDISGLTATDAVERLDTQLADLVTEPIPVTAGEATAAIDPAAAGLTFDAQATVDLITGFTLQPEVVLGHLFGLGAREPVVTVDEEALTAAVTAAAADLDVAPIDGVIEFADGGASVTTEPEDGLSVDVAAATELISSEWLTGERPFALPSTTTTPTIDDAAIDAAMSQIVEPVLSAPVTVQLNDTETSLSPEQLSAAASLSVDGSQFTLVMDGEKLARVIQDAVPSVGETPQDAQIVLENGEPTIVPAVTGTGLDPDQLAEAVAAAALATGEGERVAVAELAETQPDFSTEDAEALGVVEVVGEFQTPYPYDPTRTENLINGTAHINGTLIKPGEVFSLIDALGPITAENGYVSSHVVEDGFVTDAMGGGLSQVSTTTFNAAYEAGMEDIEHKPHSRWFDRYPPGREATMFAPSLDMKWGNNTPYGVLVQAWVSDTHVHVRLWSTKYWDVEIYSSEKYNFTSPQTIYNERPHCEPESAGPSGFTIDISRTVALDGDVNEQYSGGYSWTYQPWNRVVCGPPPSEDEPSADESGSD